MKKDFSKILRFNKIVAVLLAVCLLVITMSVKSYASTITETEAEAMFKMQEDACEAHEKLLQIIDPNYSYDYPDCYGGDYIEGRILHVQLTDETYIEYYRNLLEKYDIVQFDVVPNSYNSLMKKVKKAYQKYEKDFALIGYSVDVMKNKGELYVQAVDYESVKETINDEDINVIISEDIQEQTTVIGGSELNNNITLAGSGTYNGSTAFLTCGHGLSNNQSVTHLGTTIGTVIVNVKGSGVVGDYSIISAASGYSSTSSVYTTTTGYTTNFTGSLGTPAVGTYLNKYGRMTGQAYCKVTNTQVTINGRYNMEKALLISGSSIGGDSGGPYRAGQKFCGVHYGYNTSGGSEYVYFTPYSTIHSAGFTIKVN